MALRNPPEPARVFLSLRGPGIFKATPYISCDRKGHGLSHW